MNRYHEPEWPGGAVCDGCLKPFAEGELMAERYDYQTTTGETVVTMECTPCGLGVEYVPDP